MEQGGQSDVVLSHDPVEHVLVAVGVLNGQLIELHQLLLHQDKLGEQKMVIFLYKNNLTNSVADRDPGGSGFKSPGWIRIRFQQVKLSYKKSTFEANFHDFQLFFKMIP